MGMTTLTFLWRPRTSRFLSKMHTFLALKASCDSEFHRLISCSVRKILLFGFGFSTPYFHLVSPMKILYNVHLSDTYLLPLAPT